MYKVCGINSVIYTVIIDFISYPESIMPASGTQLMLPTDGLFDTFSVRKKQLVSGHMPPKDLLWL